MNNRQVFGCLILLPVRKNDVLFNYTKLETKLIAIKLMTVLKCIRYKCSVYRCFRIVSEIKLIIIIYKGYVYLKNM